SRFIVHLVLDLVMIEVTILFLAEIGELKYFLEFFAVEVGTVLCEALCIHRHSRVHENVCAYGKHFALIQKYLSVANTADEHFIPVINEEQVVASNIG